MSVSQFSGLEMLQAMLDGKIPPASITQTMPLKGISVEYGKVQFEATADERHLNPLGGVHGGFLATIMDSVTACAVHSALEAGISYATIDLNVKMLKPVPQNIPLIAEGKLINLTKSLGISEGSLKDSEGKLYGHATATCMILR
ncbi:MULTISPECIES: PaaI family thioesterase [Vibrio]|uniref:PaaI family thioesterase n=1 Tax=Vibrio TaxID=662 RepID=UPI000B5CCDA4|nr:MULTISPECIES: PaaI family thioesterase [Vibrio]HBV76048.1 PaaI family thioesterase [Vibrio sp.]